MARETSAEQKSKAHSIGLMAVNALQSTDVFKCWLGAYCPTGFDANQALPNSKSAATRSSQPMPLHDGRRQTE